MKNSCYIVGLCCLLSANYIFAQNQNKTKNSLIPDKFTIINDVNLKDSMNPEFMQNYPNINLTDIVLGKVFNSEVAAFDYSFYDDKIYDTLSLSQVNEKLGGGMEEVNIEDAETGELVEKKFVRNYDPSEIVKYRFLEEWALDGKNFKFSKNIIAYSPIRKFYRPEDYERTEPKYQIGFTIFNDKRGQLKPAKADKWTLVATSIYEVPLVEDPINKYPEFRDTLLKLQNEDYRSVENENSPFLNAVTQRNVAQLFYKKAMDENTIVFDMDGFYKKKEDINSAFGVRVEDIVVYDIETGDEAVKKVIDEFQPDQIRSLLFYEDWYINEATLQFDKRITAIAPIRYYIKDDSEDGTPRKQIPCVLYTNNEDKSRLEKLYYKLILSNYNSTIISHIEMFNQLGKQSKSNDFKAFCQQKQNDLYAFVLKNNLSVDEKMQLFQLSEKIKLGYSIEKMADAPLVELQTIFSAYASYIDTCSNNAIVLQYCNYSKVVGEKIIQLDDNCANRLSLLKIYEKLNLKPEIAKLQQTDKPWLIECLANYYIKSGNSEKVKTGLALYKKIFNKTLNCKALTVYLELPEELRPKNLNIDNFIAIQNEIELACFAYYLDDKYKSSNDSLFKIEMLNISEKVYSKLVELTVSKDYLIGLYRVKTGLNKPFDYNMLNQLSSADDILNMLSDIFIEISDFKTVPSTDLIKCKPFVEKLATMNVGEDDLWTLTYSIFRWKKWSDDIQSKIYSTYLEILLNRLLIMNPNSAPYLFSKYELQLEQDKNPDISNMLNQKSVENLELFAQLFSEGYNEYIFTFSSLDSTKYDVGYLINATKFYERLVELQPDNKEYTHNYSEVYYKLTWYYLITNQNAKALDCASKMNKIESNNDNGIMAMIFAYLANNQASKAYKITDSYKGKERSQKVLYWAFFKYETESLLSYKNNNVELTKYLEYLKK